MTAIIYDQFGGIIPKVDPRNLPNNAAQTAHNVELSGGNLAPINMNGGFNVRHDQDSGELTTGTIPAGDIITVSEPVKPVVADRIRLLKPAPPGVPLGDGFSWQFTVGMWITYHDANGDFQTDTESPSWDLTQGTWEYTDDGIIWRGYLFSESFTAQPGLYYQVHGPKFKIEFTQDTKYYGGPDQNYSFPDGSLTRSSPDWPVFRMPLTAPIDYSEYANDGDLEYTGERYTYGHLQLVDVNAPTALPDVDMIDKTDETSVTLMESGAVEFHFRANYTRNTQTFVHYVTSAVDQRVAEGSANAIVGGLFAQVVVKDLQYGADDIPSSGTLRLINVSDQSEEIAYTSFSLVNDLYTFTTPGGDFFYTFPEDSRVLVIDTTTVGKEGPPSDMSDQIVVEPGEILKLTIPKPDGIHQQTIYRGGTSANFRQLADEVTDDFYFDTFIDSLGDVLPPYGNFPHATAAEAREGSLFLGGHTGMIFDGKDVRPSEPYKPWVYPEEYAFPLQSDYMGGMAFGSTAVIFTKTHPVSGEEGKVLRVSGQNPAHISRHILSECKPLLNLRSICVMDQTGFYVSWDGLIAVTAGGVQNITEQFFNREQWMTYSPEFYSCYTRDSSVFLINLRTTNPVHFRVDLNDKHAMLTTLDVFSDGVLEWTGKRREFIRPTSFRTMQVHADDYPVEITLNGDDNTETINILLPDDKAKMLPRMRKCKDWEVTIRSRYKVNRLAIATNNQELRG